VSSRRRLNAKLKVSCFPVLTGISGRKLKKSQKYQDRFPLEQPHKGQRPKFDLNKAATPIKQLQTKET